MVHASVREYYDAIFGDQLGKVYEWFQNGKNSIRVRTIGASVDYIFTMSPNGRDWRLETRPYFEQTL